MSDRAAGKWERSRSCAPIDNLLPVHTLLFILFLAIVLGLTAVHVFLVLLFGRSRLSGRLRGVCARRRRSICGCRLRRARRCGWRRDCRLRLGRGRDEERLIAVQDGKRQKNCEEEPTFHVLRLGIRYRVHAVAAKRMAPCQTSAPEPHTAPRSM